MKKKIKAELIHLAEQIIEDKDNLEVSQLKQKARSLYEKLCVLAFTESYLEETPVQKKIPETPPKSKPVEKPVEKKKEQQEKSHDEFAPDGTEYNDTDAITEPNTEKIKDIVAQMPPESERVDQMVSAITTPEVEKSPENQEEKKDFRNIGVDYDNLPDFEPLKNKQKDQRPKSLNDRLKKGINIGLNERLTYIKHLFGGNTSDYNRVLSQLNTFSSLEEAQKFIQLVVKPDYNHWEGKEEYEQQFMEKVENRFTT